MRILITGSRGFIGRHLAEELREHGHKVQGVDRQGGPGTIEVDLAHPGSFDAVLRNVGEIDVVVHLAAKVGRLFGEADSIETVRQNAQVTTQIARACGEAGIPLTYASTSEVYGDRGDYTCHENDSLNVLPHNLYGLSKRWGEEACRLYAADRLTILRLSMPYGTGVVPGRGRAALPNILWQAHTRQPIPIHRGAERSWCWVGDTVRGLRLIIEKRPYVFGDAPAAFNVGRDDDPRPLVELAHLACEMTGATHELVEEVEPPTAQTVVKRLATNKLESLGWRPEVGIEEGMRRVLEWVQRFDADGRMVARA